MLTHQILQWLLANLAAQGRDGGFGDRGSGGLAIAPGQTGADDGEDGFIGCLAVEAERHAVVHAGRRVEIAQTLAVATMSV